MRSGKLTAWAVGALVLAPSMAYATHETRHEWVVDTAYTVNGGELRLGLWDWEVGVLDELTVGTSPVFWAASLFLGKPVPNGYFKLRDWFHGPLALSVRGSLLYVDAEAILEPLFQDSQEQGNLWILGLDAAATWRTRGAFSLGPVLNYTDTLVRGSSAGEGGIARGLFVLRTTQAGLWVQWRLSRYVALQTTAKVLLYQQAPKLHVQFDTNDWTSVEGQLRPERLPPRGAWSVVPSIAYSGDVINTALGVGYGYGTFPIVNFVSEKPSFIVNVEFFLRFQVF